MRGGADGGPPRRGPTGTNAVSYDQLRSLTCVATSRFLYEMPPMVAVTCECYCACAVGFARRREGGAHYTGLYLI